MNYHDLILPVTFMVIGTLMLGGMIPSVAVQRLRRKMRLPWEILCAGGITLIVFGVSSIYIIAHH